MMSNHEIISERRNQVYTLGSPSCDNHLYIFHGYAQNGADFLKEFQSFSENYFVVSIEGTSKFYTKGLFGEVGNSWMTSYNRDGEILDYLDLISKVYSQFSAGKIIKILGFSQGSQAAARWANHNLDKIDQLIMCGGLFPVDVDKENLMDKSDFVIGVNDSFISKNEQKLLEQTTNKIHLFEGKHELNFSIISSLLA